MRLDFLTCVECRHCTDQCPAANCGQELNPRGFITDARSSVEAMVTVWKNAGVSFGVLESEACCGHHSRRQGGEMQFQNLANENINVLQEQGVKKIIAAQTLWRRSGFAG